MLSNSSLEEQLWGHVNRRTNLACHVGRIIASQHFGRLVVAKLLPIQIAPIVFNTENFNSVISFFEVFAETFLYTVFVVKFLPFQIAPIVFTAEMFNAFIFSLKCLLKPSFAPLNSSCLPTHLRVHQTVWKNVKGLIMHVSTRHAFYP